ncbi:MAG: peptidylprolyl isomerase, partial [Limnochordia bacterium]
MDKKRVAIAVAVIAAALILASIAINVRRSGSNEIAAPDSSGAENSPTTEEVASVKEAGTIGATIESTRGLIELELRGDLMPLTVANFVKLAESGFYDGLTFHRVEDWVIQGGDPLGTGTGG